MHITMPKVLKIIHYNLLIIAWLLVKIFFCFVKEHKFNIFRVKNMQVKRKKNQRGQMADLYDFKEKIRDCFGYVHIKLAAIKIISEPHFK